MAGLSRKYLRRPQCFFDILQSFLSVWGGADLNATICFSLKAAAAELQGSELENDILKSSVASAESCVPFPQRGKY